MNIWEELSFLRIRYKFSNHLTKPKVPIFEEAEIHVPCEGFAAPALCHPHAWPRNRTRCAGMFYSLAASKSPYLNEPRATPGNELLPDFHATKLGIEPYKLYQMFLAQQKKGGSCSPWVPSDPMQQQPSSEPQMNNFIIWVARWLT